MLKKNHKYAKKKPNKLALTIFYSVIIFLILVATMAIVGITFMILVKIGIFSGVNKVPNTNAVILLISLTSIIIGTIIAAATSNIPLHPVKKLIGGMQSLADGNFKTRINLGNSLLGEEIADNFNTMASELEKTEEMRNEFINDFSHELKTPIVSIAGFAKLLKNDKLTEDKKLEYINIIEEESLRLSELTTKILNITRLENQEILSETSLFNISEQIRTCILILQEKWSNKNIDISVDFDEYFVTGNEDLLKEVWLNLLDNAVKFTPEKGAIEVEISKKEASVEINIFNSGSLIPQDKTDKIFNKFYQADESHSSCGNGIGLAVAKRITELHKGTISAKSNNEGTTFTVCLPVE